ncbi:MAG: ferredoxin III, nif-specific [Pseudomonadota bacterium]|nr:ferredoxin III, nif-specific [Pseudomonadota bacterium]
MSQITGTTRGGSEWIPTFITALDEETCIGCGRCFKVCPRNVFDLEEREPDDDDDEDVISVMVIADANDCIGCGSCARVCPKNCHTHEPMDA